MQKDTKDISNYISMIANILTAVSIIVGYMTQKYIFFIIIIIINFVCNIILLKQKKKLIAENNQLQDKLKELDENNRKLRKTLYSLRDNVFIGQMPIHSFMQYLPLKKTREKENICEYYKIIGNIDIVYNATNDNQTMLDVDYRWSYIARNISQKPLQYLTFTIAGENIIRDNKKLKIKAVLKRNDGKKINLLCNVIEDHLRIKKIQVDFGDFVIPPEREFYLELFYIWEKCYNITGDMFSFDPTNHPNAVCDSMEINITADNKVMNYAMLFMKKIEGIEIQNDELIEDLKIIHLGNNKCLITHKLNKNECDTQVCFIKILQLQSSQEPLLES